MNMNGTKSLFVRLSPLSTDADLFQNKWLRDVFQTSTTKQTK